MLPLGEPKFRRRKADRPEEIIGAAMAVFAERGFAAARLEEIAARAGISKGALYLYFETKEDIFRAVVERGIAPNLHAVRAIAAAHPGPLPDLLRMITQRIVAVSETLPVSGVVKMVISEARNFPQIAKLWHDEMVAAALDILTEIIRAAQARGEVRAGDPRIHAISLIGPMVVGLIWGETFVPVGARPFDLRAVAAQNLDSLLNGILVKEDRR